MNEVLISIIIFFGVFTQSLSGFGLGLIAMPLLVEVIELKIAAPLLALVALITITTLALHYKSNFEFKLVLPLIIASSMAIPLGIFVLKNLDNQFGLAILGLIVTSYSLYSLFNFPLPEIRSVKLGYGLGFLSGLLSGAYNTGGPPIVIYANCCRWNLPQFKSNISGFFLINVIFVNINHLMQGNLTPEVWRLFLYTIPTIFIGLFAGLFLSRFLNPLWFRQIVLVLLLVTGVKLLVFS